MDILHKTPLPIVSLAKCKLPPSNHTPPHKSKTQQHATPAACREIPILLVDHTEIEELVQRYSRFLPPSKSRSYTNSPALAPGVLPKKVRFSSNDNVISPTTRSLRIVLKPKRSIIRKRGFHSQLDVQNVAKMVRDMRIYEYDSFLCNKKM